MQALRSDSFRAWPTTSTAASTALRTEYVAQGLRLTKVDFQSEAGIPLTLWVMQRADMKPEELQLVVLNVLDDESWRDYQALAANAFPEVFPGDQTRR